MKEKKIHLSRLASAGSRFLQNNGIPFFFVSTFALIFDLFQDIFYFEK